MLQIVGVNNKGDYIVSTTSSIGKTQMELEEIGMIMSWQRAEEQLTARTEAIKEALKAAMAVYVEAIDKAAETLWECLNPLLKEWGRQGKTISEMIEEIQKIFDSVEDSEELYRVKKEKRRQNLKAYTRDRGKPRGQQGKTIKYKPYELRAYGI